MQLGAQVLETDEVIVYNEDGGGGQASTSYVASAGEMYELLSEALAEDTRIDEGAGFIVSRGVGDAEVITFPAQPVTE